MTEGFPTVRGGATWDGGRGEAQRPWVTVTESLPLPGPEHRPHLSRKRPGDLQGLGVPGWEAEDA